MSGKRKFIVSFIALMLFFVLSFQDTFAYSKITLKSGMKNSNVTALQKENDMTIFFTTYYMEEATAADYVIIIDKGKISAKGTPAELKETYTSDKLILICSDIHGVTGILDKDKTGYTIIANEVVVKIPVTMAALPIIEKCREYISGFEVLNGTMDDAFIAVCGKEIRA
jgi:multidrug/hemolysin transport system ATP-binding protein